MLLRASTRATPLLVPESRQTYDWLACSWLEAAATRAGVPDGPVEPSRPVGSVEFWRWDGRESVNPQTLSETVWVFEWLGD